MSSPNLIRVGIADDHALVRKGLRQMIQDQDDMALAGEAWDGRTAIELVRAKSLDVLVLDIFMPGHGGLDALASIRAKSPETAVLILSTCPEEHYAAKMLRRGARGYLNKQCEPSEIVDAIRQVARGDRYITEPARDALLDEVADRLPKHPHEKLTDREFQLLVRLAQGQGTNEIAEELSLSPKTTSTYRNSLLGKLGLKTNSDLTHYAMVHGLID